MEKSFKRLLSFVVAFVMVLGMVPVNALNVFAASDDLATDASNYVAQIGSEDPTTLAEALNKAEPGDTITLLADVDAMPSISKAVTIKGAEGETIEINCAIAENFPDIDGTVTFENLIFNDRISTENASTDQSKLTLKFVNCTFNVPANNTYAIQGGASWNNDVLGGLIVEECTFTTTATSFVKGYMIYAQCVKNVSVTGSTLDGNNAYRGAIHLGDSTEYATAATIEGNTIKNFARGVQLGNRVDGTTVSVTGNTFDNINAITGETEAAALYIHEVANAASVAATVTNNTVTSSNDGTPVVFSENATGSISEFVSAFTGNKVNGEAVTAENEDVYLDTVYEAPAISGTFMGGHLNLDDPNEIFITTEIQNLNATKSVEVMIYSGGTLIATSTLLNKGYFVSDVLTVKTCLTGDSGTWGTKWEKGHPNAEFAPTSGTLYVDEKIMSSAEIKMRDTKDNLIDWADVPGVNAAVTYVAQVGEEQFTSVLDAIAYATENSAAEVVLLANSEEVMPEDINILLKADLKITAAEAVEAKFYNNGTSYDFCIDTAEGVTDVPTLTIDKNVTFNLNDRTVWLGYYGRGIQVQVDGTLRAGNQLWAGTDVNVSSTGKLISAGEALVLRYGKTLTVDGGVLDVNYINILEGHIILKNTTVTTGPVWAGSDPSSVVLEKAKLISSSNLKLSGNSSFTLSSGSEATFVLHDGYGHSEISENGKLVINDTSKISITEPIFAGTLIIDAANMEDGDVYTAMTADLSDFTGDIQVVNSELVAVIENNQIVLKAAPVAKIGETGYTTLQAAIAEAEAGETVMLLTDVTLSEILTIDKAITLDGGNNKLTSTANRAINVNCAGEVTIQNLTIVGGKGCQRGINVIRQAGTTNLANVTVSGVSHYAVNIAATAGAAQVNISNSNLSGYGALTIYGNGSTVKVTDSALVGVNTYADNGSNGFSTIAADGENITVTVTGGSVTAKSTDGTAHQGIIGSTGVENLVAVLDTQLVTEGTASIMSLKLADNTLSFRAEYADELMAEGYAVSESDASGLVGVTGVAVAKIGDTNYATLDEALAEAKAGDTIALMPGATISEGEIALPTLNNVTIKGAEGAVLKDTALAARVDPVSLTGLTIDGVVFDNSKILVVRWTNNCEFKDWVIKNCTFKNLTGENNEAPIHLNVGANVALENLTFTGNTLDNLTGGSKSGIYGQYTGKIVIEDNTFNNIAFRPYVIQLTTDDGVADELIVTGNTFSGSAAGRAQALTNNAEGTDTVKLVVSENIFKDITSAQQICYWSFNEETTTADLSKNYYDIDILNNPDRIYYNSAAQNAADLIEMGIYPYYADEAMTQLVEAPKIMVTYADGKIEYFNDMIEAIPYSTNVPKLEGATIKLLADVTGKGIRFMETGMVLDLNGHTYTINNATGSSGTNTSGFQIREDAAVTTIKNGTIQVAAPADMVENTSVIWMFNSYSAELIIEDVTVDCANMAYAYGESVYIHVSRPGDNTVLKGDTQFINFNSDNAGHAINVGGDMTMEETVVPGGSFELDAGATLTAPAGLTVATADGYKVVYENGVYSTKAVNYVAYIGEQGYETVDAAVQAAKDGETIRLDSENTAISMYAVVAGKTVTFTGKALVDWTLGNLWVGRLSNAGDGKVIFDGATITSSAKKQNASTGIHVSGATTADATNDGVLEIKNSTIELDYLINRNTVTISDNSHLTVYGGFLVHGRAANESDSQTDETAIVNVENSKLTIVNMNGCGVGFESYGELNLVNAELISQTDFIVRENGKVNVSGTSDISANVTDSGWIYMNGVTLDADTKLTGANVRFASGTNNIDGSVIDDGFFQVGIGAYNGKDANVDTDNGVTVNVKNATIGSNGKTYGGWIGTGYYDTDAEKAEAMTDAKYVLNIENSIANFGYLHVSNDGELNVKGNAAEKAHYNNSDYSFYAGDFIINGVATFDATDVLALYTKVSCDNGTDKPGTLNIVGGTEYEAERHNGAISGTNFTLYKTGVVNVAKGADLYIGEYTSIAADAVLNIAGTATALGTITNNGTINLTDVDATLTTPEAPKVLSGVEDYMVSYKDGAYQLIAIPARPTATVNEIPEADLENAPEMTFALQFNADEPTDEQLAYYGDWYADFVLTVNKEVTFDCNGGADGYLAGEYGDYDWISVPFTPVTMNANEPLKIMEYAAQLMGQPGLKFTYAEVVELVKTFNCGVFLTPAFIAANPDLEVTLELRMYNNEDETESYGIGETYVFTYETIAVIKDAQGKVIGAYNSVEAAAAAAEVDQTVVLLANCSAEEVYIRMGRTLDLNGYRLTTDGDVAAANATAHIIDSSNGKGILVAAQNAASFNAVNKYLPVWVEGEGFHFVTHTFTTRVRTNATHPASVAENAIQFRFWMDGAADCFLAQQLADGGADNSVSVKIKMTWTNAEGVACEQYFTFTEELVVDYASKWDSKVLFLTIKGAADVSDVEFTAMMTYDNVQFTSAVHSVNAG